MTRVLILPGWQNAGAVHWQSRWQAPHGFERVQQADWDWPRRRDWMVQLEEAVLLVAPPDTARSDMPQSTWRAVVGQRLPFEALMPYSTDDPLRTGQRALAIAADWGAEAASLASHPNGDSGPGDGPEGIDWLQRLREGVR